MRRIRVIPTLLLDREKLVKTKRFSKPQYIGDPINAVRIFNEKEVDELVLLDISASREGRSPDIKRIGEIAGEAFMPIGYGGGISTLEQIKALFFEGVEKVILNTAALNNAALLGKAAAQFGSQSIVASIDVKKDWLGRYRVFSQNGSKNTGLSPVVQAKIMQEAGAGEIILNAIDRDGAFEGYDLELLKIVGQVVSIPVVAAGGAASNEDFYKAITVGKASACSAGALFVYQLPHRAVLISYPSQESLKKELFDRL